MSLVATDSQEYREHLDMRKEALCGQGWIHVLTTEQLAFATRGLCARRTSSQRLTIENQQLQGAAASVDSPSGPGKQKEMVESTRASQRGSPLAWARCSSAGKKKVLVVQIPSPAITQVKPFAQSRRRNPVCVLRSARRNLALDSVFKTHGQ